MAGALVLAVMLNACGGQGAGTAGGEKASGEEASEEEASGEEASGQERVSDEDGDDSGERADGGSLEASEAVKKAMDAADTLTTGEYFLLPDGSVVTRGETIDNFAGDYAALPDVKKIADSSSQMELLALTEGGDLYFHQTKL